MSTAVNLRTQQHQCAKKLMKAGKTIDALFSFKKNLNENGEHIFLLVDIAACYYTLQDHILFKTWAEKAHSTFLSMNSFFSDETYIRSAIAIGRFLEELGNFDQAVKIYDCCLHKDLDHQMKLLGKLYAQGLRVKSFIGDKDSLYDFYQACLKKINILDPQTDGTILIEIYHALMMSDLYLGNLSLAQSWLEKALLYTANKYEKNWIVIDFLADTLIQHNTKKILDQTSYADCDAYEQAIINLFEDKIASLDTIQKMSNIGRFRYFEILQKLRKKNSTIIDSKAYDYLKNSLNFFDALTRKKLIKRWTLTEHIEAFEILKYKEYILIKMNHADWHISVNSLYGKLLNIFYNNKTNKCSIDEALKLIYEEDLSMSGIDKLRQLVYRLNHDIKKQLHTENFFKISSYQIKIRN